MHLPFPVRVPIWQVCLFATVLSLIQLTQGTSPLFSLFSALFIIVSGLAFNTAGGLSKPSGAYIFFYSVLAVILGLCVKAFLGEAADSNLLVPMTTIEVYLGGAFGLLIAAFMSKQFSSKKGKIQDILPLDQMKVAATGCLALGLLLGFAPAFIPGGNGSLLSALVQVNRFLPMSLILAIMYQIRKTGGRSSFNSTAFLSFGFTFVVEGLINLSKQGMFTPMFSWLVCAAALRYRITAVQAIGILLIFLFVFFYLVPYVQYTRTAIQVEGDSLAGRLTHFTELDKTRKLYEEDDKWNNQAARYHYFNSAVGLFDRLQMFSIDDALIKVTDPDHPFGITPLWGALFNVIPRVFWPNKPTLLYGNVYAHEINILPPDDFSTGISFTPTADAFHEARWIGIFVMCPILWTILFVTFDSVCGDTRESPWSLLMAAFFAHVAPEGMIGGIISLLTVGLVGVLFCATFSAYVLPILGRIFTRADGTVKFIQSPPSPGATLPQRS